MKKIIFASVVSLSLISAGVAFAQTVQCGTQSDGTIIPCPQNGMPLPEPTGWHYVPVGIGECPAWFPPAGCYSKN